jgi:hypothetical protein
MTERKSLKRRVRARMEKTGERYTAARRHVVDERAAAPEPVEPARERVSEEAVVRNTGRSWEEWFAVLDDWDATTRSHRDIARHLREELGVPGWWSQTVTVEYERARGMRAKHQRPSGFSVTASKTVGVPVEVLFEAVLDRQDEWLPDGGLSLRTAQHGRSARFDWQDGRTRLIAGFDRKGEAKSLVAVEHERLADAEEGERMKAFWRERLVDLKRLLES